MATVLIVDDDRALRESLAETVTDLGHHAVLAASGKAGLTQLDAERIDAILLDLRMPDMDGLEVLRRVRSRAGAPAVVVLTAFATAANTIEAMRLGAFDHLTKPIGRQELAALLERMLPKPSTDVTAKSSQPDDVLVGSSEPMRAVQKTIGLLADSDATVLILGETGTSALQARFGGTVPSTGVGDGLTSFRFARIGDPACLPMSHKSSLLGQFARRLSQLFDSITVGAMLSRHGGYNLRRLSQFLLMASVHYWDTDTRDLGQGDGAPRHSRDRGDPQALHP
jgi:CheY-like chemotaxis protein